MFKNLDINYIFRNMISNMLVYFQIRRFTILKKQ
jgi:hypothetical protein